MQALLTPEAVITAVGVRSLSRYQEIVPLTDAAGFSAKRPYPDSTPLGSVRDKAGRPTVLCLIRFIVDRTTAPSGVSAVRVYVSAFDKWGDTRWRGHDFSDPECPTPESVRLMERSAKPLRLDFEGEFVYDAAEGRFYGPNGERVTGPAMLDHVYDYHVRTLSWPFRLKHFVKRGPRIAFQKIVWGGQGLSLWLLEHGYEISTTVPKPTSPFHVYRMSEFTGSTSASGTQFFGLQVSARRLFSNLLTLAASCMAAYIWFRDDPLLKAIYRNTPLSTVALLFGFMVGDQVMPFVLKLLVVLASRLKRYTFHLAIRTPV